VGVLDYGWNAGSTTNWVYPFGEVGDKKQVLAAISQMQMGDMPDLHAPIQAAYSALNACNAGRKHIIVITDGDPNPPSQQLLDQMRAAGITLAGVVINPHQPGDVDRLRAVSYYAGGNFYLVEDPQNLPQIFIKEAQVIRRALIQEEPFQPQVVYSLSEIIKGLGQMPPLEGLVLTGPKGGLTNLVMTNADGDPVLATAQMGLGRTLAFTSSADARWAGAWLGWGGYGRFWEQAVRWASKPAQASDCEVFTDVRGQKVEVTVEAMESSGKFVQFASISGQVLGPDLTAKDISLAQVGPGRYRAEFSAPRAGGYVLNLRYARPGGQGQAFIQAPVTVPYAAEYRDLSDNSALLAEVARTTGGRVVGGPPEEARLFDRDKLKFPQSATPLTGPLLLAWVGLFLADVAARRVAVDFRAIARRAAALIVRRRKAQAAAAGTLDRLKLKRQKLRERLAARPADATASRKYQAGADETGELPIAKEAPPAAQGPAEPDQTGQAPAGQTHLDRLLKAKQQASERRKKG
jgi:hypothetical protein